jgi:hypothetical protein
MTHQEELAALRTQLEQAQQAIGLATTAVPTMEMDTNDPVGMMQRVVAEVTALKEALELAKDWGCFGPGMTIDGFTAKHGNVSKEQMAQIVARALSGEGRP